MLSNFFESLKVMGLGMLGIFAVVIVIMLVMILITKVFPGEK